MSRHESELVESARYILGSPFYADIKNRNGFSGDISIFRDGNDVIIRSITNVFTLTSSVEWGFYLTTAPYCCGVVTCGYYNLYHSYRGKGATYQLLDLQQRICKRAGFSLMQCTTVDNYSAFNHILQKMGWNEAVRFRNSRSGNTVIEWCKTI